MYYVFIHCHKPDVVPDVSSVMADLSLRRHYLHDQVAERLRTLILSGDLPPRSRVNELDLAARFGISRTPLREAIKILATEGLLELLPNRGARVSHLSEVEIEDMLAVIGGLEATAADLACRRITAAEIEAVAADHAAMLEAYWAGDEAAYFAHNRAIHEGLMRAARNPLLASLYAGLMGRVARARYMAHKTPAQWRKAVADHQRMLVLLRRRDGAGLATLMRRHIHGKHPVIAAAYGAGTDGVGPGTGPDHHEEG